MLYSQSSTLLRDVARGGTKKTSWGHIARCVGLKEGIQENFTITLGKKGYITKRQIRRSMVQTVAPQLQLILISYLSNLFLIDANIVFAHNLK